MRGKKAKELRKKVYGTEFAPRERRYVRDKTGTIICIERRQQYQQLKKKVKQL